MNKFNLEVGKKIKKARKDKKMSMKKLGELVNLHESTISRYEKGEILSLDIDKLKEFAKVLDISTQFLMGLENEKEDESVIIGRNIQTIRNEKNISLTELAEEIHIDYQVLVQYEKGIRKVPRNILIKIASYLQVSVDNLMGIHVGHDNNTTFLTQNKDVLENYKVWQEEIGYDVRFTTEEVKKIIEYAKFLVSQREK